MNTMLIDINGKEYEFKASIRFMRELDKKVKDKSGSREINAGMTYAMAGVIDGNIDDLIDVLYTMNYGFDPRIEKKELEEYIEDCEDIDALFEKVCDFLSKANVSKKRYSQLMEAIEKNKEKAKV